MTLDHIGIFVRDIEDGQKKLEAILPIGTWGEIFDDDALNVRVCFGEIAPGLRYELVAPFGSPNPVSGVLESGRNVLNHVAYRVADFDAAATALRETGAVPMGPAKPAIAFGGARVIFFLTALGFIVELVENVQERR